MKTESVLEKILASGNLAVTSECGPPRGAVPEKVKEKACEKQLPSWQVLTTTFPMSKRHFYLAYLLK